MYKFENAMLMTSKLSAADKMKLVKEETRICICPDCPTYTDCANNDQESLFCAHGASFVCISGEMDCICPFGGGFGALEQLLLHG